MLQFNLFQCVTIQIFRFTVYSTAAEMIPRQEYCFLFFVLCCMLDSLLFSDCYNLLVFVFVRHSLGLTLLFLVCLSRKEQIAEQREYKKKKAQKKVQRMKELEQEREEQKSKWQQFNNKAYSKNKKGQVFIMYFFMFHVRGKAVEQTTEFVIL